MASVPVCPNCGSALREIVWGYGTIADVEDAGDVVIGGCVIDVDDVGRVAALQCPICGTRTDAEGVALEAPQPPATTGHPFDVSFSSPPRERWEVTMTDPGRSGQDSNGQGSGGPDGGAQGAPGDGPGFVDEDFGGAAPGGNGWRDHVEPYASRDDALPPPSAPTPERVDPYASRENALPSGGQPTPDRVEPYASRSGDVPPASAPSREHVDPYASRDDVLPEATGAWQERIEPFAGAPGEEPPLTEAAAPAAPGEAIDARWGYTSDFTDAEEEGWPPGRRDDD